MTLQVFIDGEVGTTGLQIRERLETRADITLLRLPNDRRKDVEARRAALNAADIAILCLPDDAAREAVSLIQNDHTRVIDASTAYRVDPDWTYGFPELSREQTDKVRGAKRVSNPGCYPTGFLGLVAPLVRSGLVPADWPFTVNAVSGYSGGGKAMIAEFEDISAPNYTRVPFRLYATGMGHKHVPEMQTHAGLAHPPLFQPAVGRYAQGMLVEVPLHTALMPLKPMLAQLHGALAEAYQGRRFVEVASLDEAASVKSLDPEGLNGTNLLKLFVFGSDKLGQARLVALLDNLGKGASGAAVQNLNLMAGFDEGQGL